MRIGRNIGVTPRYPSHENVTVYLRPEPCSVLFHCLASSERLVNHVSQSP